MPMLFLFFTSILAVATFFLAQTEPALRRLSLFWSTLVGLCALAVAYPVLASGQAMSTGAWFIDGLAAILMLLVGFVQWTATLVSAPYLKAELHEGTITLAKVRVYHVMLQLFVLSMLLALSANSIGLMWIALEATTLSTTMLVAFYTREGSLEAAWKYIVLCSVGISLGLLGVLLVFYASSVSSSGALDQTLSWTALHGAAAAFPAKIMRWAFVFIFIGYGAKVGLVPMHTWLPDAHGRTPSPISGMLSGVLLSVALFAILRFKGLTDLALGSSVWTDHFFLFFGALSFCLSSAFILIQSNYKRLLAYSSIEHMGFMVFCIGLGTPLAQLAALVHLIGHALAKSLLFYGTGNMLLRWKSTKVEHIGAVLRALPYTGSLFVLGLLALLAVPPSPLFLSEVLGFGQALTTHLALALGLLLVGTIVFAGMIRHLLPMVFRRDSDQTHTPAETWNLSHTAMGLHALALVVLGLMFFAPPVQAYLMSIMAGF